MRETEMSSIAKGVAELYDVLCNEADIYRQLVAATEQERLALQKQNMIELATVTRDKEMMLQGLAKWEQTRQRLVAAVGDTLGLPAGASLLDLILHLVDDPLVQKLSSLRQEFISLVEQLLGLNYGNQLLLQTGLARIDATFDYLASAMVSADGSYSAKGNSQAQLAIGNVLNWQI